MYSDLTGMLATAHRDELLRQASRHNQVRPVRRSSAASNTRGFVVSVLSFRFTRRGSGMRPAVAA